MACALGVTPLTVREDMTLDDVLDLDDYWQNHPPVQWMVQWYLGIKEPTLEPTKAEIAAALARSGMAAP